MLGYIFLIPALVIFWPMFLFALAVRSGLVEEIISFFGAIGIVVVAQLFWVFVLAYFSQGLIL